MIIKLFEANNGNCPYLADKQWICYLVQSNGLNSLNYETLINQGFRRNGRYFYRNNCQGCKQCIALRVPVADFTPSKSQRRIWRKNCDLRIKTERVGFDEESYQLYLNYSIGKHNSQVSKDDYNSFLIQTTVDTLMMKYYLKDRLLAVGWVDILPHSISSVYFAFDLDFSKRGLGIFSIMYEISLCQKLDKEFLHLGFWVKNNQKMNYKSRFNRHQLLINNHWIEAEDSHNLNISNR
jgi:arginine-tRNA-protein transferase